MKISNKLIFRIQPLLIFIYLCAVGCNTNNQSHSTTSKIIEVDMEQREKQLTLTGITGVKIELIQLKTHKNMFFENIDIFKVDKNNLYAYNDRGKALYCFSKDGDYLFSINRVGHGPGEVASFMDFLINPFSNTIEVMDRKNGKILNYSQNGSFIKETKYEFEGHYFEVIDSNTYAVFANYQINEWSPSGNLFFVNSSYQKTESFLPIDERFSNLAFLFPVRFTLNDNNNYLFTETHSNNVYEIINHKPVLKYQIDFGKYNIPERITNILPKNSEINAIERINKQRKYLEALDKQGYCYFIENFFEGKQYLGFKFTLKNSAQLYLKKKDSNKALIFEKSFLLDNKMQLFNIQDILLMQDDMIYAYTRPEDLLKYKKELEARYTLAEINEQNTQFPYLKTIYDLATQAYDGSSPVLLKIKLDS